MARPEAALAIATGDAADARMGLEKARNSRPPAAWMPPI